MRDNGIPLPEQERRLRLGSYPSNAHSLFPTAEAAVRRLRQLLAKVSQLLFVFFYPSSPAQSLRGLPLRPTSLQNARLLTARLKTERANTHLESFVSCTLDVLSSG